jgi:hypothetical protein
MDSTELRNQVGVKAVGWAKFDIDLFRPRPRIDPNGGSPLRIAAMIRQVHPISSKRNDGNLRRASRTLDLE